MRIAAVVELEFDPSIWADARSSYVTRSRLCSKSGPQPQNSLWLGGLSAPYCKIHIHGLGWDCWSRKAQANKSDFLQPSDLVTCPLRTPTIPPEVVGVKGCVLDTAECFLTPWPQLEMAACFGGQWSLCSVVLLLQHRARAGHSACGKGSPNCYEQQKLMGIMLGSSGATWMIIATRRQEK